VRRLVLIAVLATTLLGAGSARAETTLYVGDTEDYAITFKAEEGQLYIVELAADTECFFTEPREGVGPGGFSAFASPWLMSSDSEGFGTGIPGGLGGLRAEPAGDGFAGRYYLHQIVEEGFHCETAPDSTFQAVRYLPFGGGGAPASGERPVYYGKDESTETFLRVIGDEVGGIRGTFVPQCRIGRARKVAPSHALFAGPSDFTKLGEGGSFEEVEFAGGRIHGKTRFMERISVSGTVAEDAVTGAYLRVRTVKPPHRAKRRCVTGPLPFRAARYLPPAS
jgi:hypothetical protein